MSGLLVAPSSRLRRTPFWDGVLAEGVKACSVYNRMLLPTLFRTPEEDYRHLKEHVQLWDVSCQRQAEISGPDAERLVQMLTPRFIGGMRVRQCKYAPVVDDKGGMLNDPVLVKLAGDRFWFSLADSDFLLMAKGLAIGAGLDAEVFEPDVSPLAVQGPKSEELMRRVFGPRVADVGFFEFDWFEFGGTEHVVSRSGYSKQGGFEIYLDGTGLGMPLWRELMAAGADLEVGAGCPTYAERVEAGLLSYGNDITSDHNPFECGLGKFCDLAKAVSCIGRDALLEAERKGLARQIRYLSIDGPPVPPLDRKWPVTCGGEAAGSVGSATWSPDFRTNVAIAMISRECFADGTRVQVDAQGEIRDATVRERTFI